MALVYTIHMAYTYTTLYSYPETLNMKAKGVGGVVPFIVSAEIPVGIGGVSGLRTVRAVEHDILLLLPVDFCKKFGLIPNMPESSMHWKHINHTAMSMRLVRVDI
jgi:hypothetical protein